jgi:hypothetical protein
VGGACGTNWGKEKGVQVTVGKSEGKKSLGRPRRRWIDNIKIGSCRDNIGWFGLD